jgi:hypothetical protein
MVPQIFIDEGPKGVMRVSSVRLRAREFGVKLGSMEPGRLNAITDVEGVGVGHSTLLEGDSVRTGVTAIAPHPGTCSTRRWSPPSTSSTPTVNPQAYPR